VDQEGQAKRHHEIDGYEFEQLKDDAEDGDQSAIRIDCVVAPELRCDHRGDETAADPDDRRAAGDQRERRRRVCLG
jgi:hypothetical protein